MACFFIVLILWVFSVCLHEFGHAFVALKGGDYTVRDKGYLTLNPLRYTDPIFSVALPILFLVAGGIGLPGGAVYIERHLLRSKQWETLVALGGPAMNIVLIFLIALLFKIGLIPNNPDLVGPIAMAFVLKLQITALLFNLLPIPPLDGFQAFAPWMPMEARERAYSMSNFTLIALFLILRYSMTANVLFFGIVNGISSFLGVSPQLGYDGYVAFQFWKH